MVGLQNEFTSSSKDTVAHRLVVWHAQRKAQIQRSHLSQAIRDTENKLKSRVTLSKNESAMLNVGSKNKRNIVPLHKIARS